MKLVIFAAALMMACEPHPGPETDDVGGGGSDVGGEGGEPSLGGGGGDGGEGPNMVLPSYRVGCEPGARMCWGAGQSMLVCGEDHTWKFLEQCPILCKVDTCVGVCQPGQRRCDGPNVQVCLFEDANWWTQEECESGVCQDGVCVD